MADISSVSSILESPPTASPAGAALSRRSVVAAGVFAVPAVTLLSQSPASANTSVLPQIAIEAAGGVIPATGPVAVTVTVRSLAGALLPGQVVSLTGPPDSNFASSDGTTDGSGRFTTTFWLAKPWITPGTTITITAVSTGTSASQAFTVVGSNMLATGPNTWGHIGNGAPGGQWVTPAQTLPVFPSPVVQVASGEAHTVVLLANGTVWTAGNPAYGRLGRDTNVVPYTQFGQVPGLSDVTQIAAQRNGCYALSAGKVYAWGWNNWGQVGDGTTVDRDRPTLVSGLSGVITLAAGRVNGLVILADKTVRAWGAANEKGQVGNGSTSNQLTPVTVTGLSDIVQLAGGNDTHSALKSDGTVWAWGANDQGQVGDGTNITQLTPVMVAPLNPVRYSAIARGGDTGYAIVADAKQVVAWGRNNEGQVGSGPAGAPTELLPREVDGMTNIVILAAGVSSAYAKKADSTVFAWGLNTNGELGVGDTTSRNLPTPVAGLSGRFISAISSGAQMTAAYFVAESATVTVDVDSQVTAGAAGAVTASVVAPSSAVMNTALTLSATGDTTLGATSGTTDGAGHFSTTVTPNVWTRPGSVLRVTASCDAGAATDTFTVLGANTLHAGYSAWTAGGDGTWNNHTVATQSSRQFPSPVVQVYTGFIFAVALLADGTVWSVGRNDSGQLGDPSIPVYDGGASSGPSMQGRSTWGRVPGLPTNIVEISGGRSTVYALGADGIVHAWGWNGNGQVGNGNTVDQTGPVQVANLTGVKRVCGAYRSAFAILNDGSVMAWGSDRSGNLGDGRGDGTATVDQLTPLAVPGWGTVTDIGGDHQQTAALRTDGTVWTCSATSGTLGNGTAATSAVPVQVSGLSNVSALGFGFGFFHALRADKTVVGWGANDVGQLGIGSVSTSPALSPTPVSALAAVSQIADGWGGGYALLSNGQVWGWGQNSSGELADGTTALRKAPVQMTGIGARPISRIDAGISAAGAYLITADATVTVDVDAQVPAGTAGVVQVAVTAASAPVANASLTLSATGGAVLGSASGSTSNAGAYQTSVTPDVWTMPGSVLRVAANSDLGSGADTYRVLGANALGFGRQTGYELGGDGATGPQSSSSSVSRTQATQLWREFPSPVVQMVSTGSSGDSFYSYNSSFALLQDGSVWAVGGNSHGQIGDGVQTYHASWTKVPGLPAITQISAGNLSVYALDSSGKVWAWGDNYFGQIGANAPAQGRAQTPVQVPGLATVRQVSAASQNAYFLVTDGSVWSVGLGGASLGAGSTTQPDTSTPVQVSGLSGVTQIAGRAGGGIALKNDGTVWSWGVDYSGALGSGTTPVPPRWSSGIPEYSSATPVQVARLTGKTVTAVAGFLSGGVALTSDGAVFAWGDGVSGTLGDGASTSRSVATPVQGLDSGVRVISASGLSAYAIKTDGSVVAWGNNSSGQLGDGSTANHAAPVAVAGLAGRSVTALMTNSPVSYRMFTITS
ncbi:RCC1 domain-containing protein [Microbacterium sp. CFBP 8794]|uniref:RCC1 domain-containing protein n=1 Tax=Microbacterium sp. CFBP 8794 TaxID=2775269 RepID=UPI001785BF30|nr:hypothetical protein [Microbacterium sp. CFBP 8794]MBD8478598.1 hypothetical protein [Microbacterium sp. CFBP 8794]